MRQDYELKIERLPEVLSRTGLSRSQLYYLQKQKLFPPSLKLGGREVGFVSAEVNQWIAGRIDARDRVLAK